MAFGDDFGTSTIPGTSTSARGVNRSLGRGRGGVSESAMDRLSTPPALSQVGGGTHEFGGVLGGVPAPATPAPPAFNANTNAGPLMQADKADQVYKQTMATNWWNQQQQAMRPPAPIPGTAISGPPAPGTPPAPTAPATPPTPITPAHMTLDGKTTYSDPIPGVAGPAAPGSQPTAPASTLPGFSQLNPAEQHYNANTTATGTLRVQFPNESAPGVPDGTYRTVDASAPRDVANLQANAKSNALTSPEFGRAVASDPNIQKNQQAIADVKSANAAHMPLSLYQQHQQALANPQQAQQNADLASLTPKDRLAYQRQQAVDQQKGEQEKATLAQKDAQSKQQQANADRTFKLAQDKQTFATLGTGAKFVIGAAKEFGNWWTKTGQQAAQNAKTEEQKANADREFHLKFENQVTSTWKQMTAKNPKLTSDDYNKMRSDMETRIYGAPRNQPQTATGNQPTAQPSTPGAQPVASSPLPPNGTNINFVAPGHETNPQTGFPMAKNGEALTDANLAQQFLQAAGGDKDKARAMAKQHGWSL